MLRYALWIATLLALLVLQWQVWERRSRTAGAPGGRLLPGDELRGLDDPDTPPFAVRALLWHADPLVTGRALERIHRDDLHEELSEDDLSRIADLVSRGTELERRGGVLVLLSRSFGTFFSTAVRLLESGSGPVTRRILIREGIRLGLPHRTFLREVREGPVRIEARWARVLLFWMDRGQVPARPPGYPDLRTIDGLEETGPLLDPDRPVGEEARESAPRSRERPTQDPGPPPSRSRAP